MYRYIFVIVMGISSAASAQKSSDTSCAQDAVKLREEKAAAGDPKAQFWLGTQLDLGECGTRDRQRGVQLLQEAAARDFPPAAHILGVLLRREGRHNEAIKYFERSAELGFQSAFADLGFTYGQRDSPVFDAVSSNAWLTLAIARESSPRIREFLERARQKAREVLNAADLERSKAMSDELALRFSRIPIWRDNE